MTDTALTSIRFEDIPGLQGTQLTGDWFQVDADRPHSFDHATYTDTNAPSFGQELYPAGLVEGFHLLGLLDHLTNAILRCDPTSTTGWNYGLEKVRFVTPVTVDDRIRLHLTVADVRAKDDGYVLTFDCTVEHSNSERPAFVAVWNVYWLPVR